MNGNVVQFFEQRAIHLSILHLTRRSDLIVTQPRHDYGLDILVEIGHAARATGRMFGVQIKALQELPIRSQLQEGSHDVVIPLQPSPQLEDLPFPLCWFVFQMRDDAGFYRWPNEPYVPDGDTPLLCYNAENIFTPLTSEAVDHIVDQVDMWYERRQTSERRVVFA